MTDKRREIDWASAEAHEGSVVIGLTGKPSKAWSESFDAVLRLLGKGSGRWGEISLEQKTIEVQALEPRAEDDLRHFLESVVVQVNSELGESEQQPQTKTEQDPQAARDEQMTATLRSFGEAQSDESNAA